MTRSAFDTSMAAPRKNLPATDDDDGDGDGKADDALDPLGASYWDLRGLLDDALPRTTSGAVWLELRWSVRLEDREALQDSSHSRVLAASLDELLILPRGLAREHFRWLVVVRAEDMLTDDYFRMDLHGGGLRVWHAAFDVQRGGAYGEEWERTLVSRDIFFNDPFATRASAPPAVRSRGAFNNNKGCTLERPPADHSNTNTLGPGAEVLSFDGGRIVAEAGAPLPRRAATLAAIRRWTLEGDAANSIFAPALDDLCRSGRCFDPAARKVAGDVQNITYGDGASTDLKFPLWAATGRLRRVPAVGRRRIQRGGRGGRGGGGGEGGEGGEGSEGGEGGDGVGEEEGFRVIHAPLIPERRRMEMLTQMEMLGNVRRDYHDAEPVEDIVDPVSEYTH